MKVKIERPVGMSEEEAEEKLHKALDAKKQARETVGEQYTDSMVNDFHASVTGKHNELITELSLRIKGHIERYIIRG